MTLFSWGQFITLMILAVAISMDAFSLGFGVGVGGIRFRQILKVSMVIGLFHVLMPLIGILLAHSLSNYIGNLATLLGGWLLIFMGLRMVWTAIMESDHIKPVPMYGLNMILFSLTVSMDALSIGFSLGLFSVNTWLTVILFGFWGTIMSILGLVLGRHVGHWLGHYGEAMGGCVLLILGCKFIF